MTDRRVQTEFLVIDDLDDMPISEDELRVIEAYLMPQIRALLEGSSRATEKGVKTVFERGKQRLSACNQGQIDSRFVP